MCHSFIVFLHIWVPWKYSQTCRNVECRMKKCAMAYKSYDDTCLLCHCSMFIYIGVLSVCTHQQLILQGSCLIRFLRVHDRRMTSDLMMQLDKCTSLLWCGPILSYNFLFVPTYFCRFFGWFFTRPILLGTRLIDQHQCPRHLTHIPLSVFLTVQSIHIWLT